MSLHDIATAVFSPDGTRIVTASNDATMSTQNLVVEACAHPLANIPNLTRKEMRLLGYAYGQSEIDVCEGVQYGNAAVQAPPPSECRRTSLRCDSAWSVLATGYHLHEAEGELKTTCRFLVPRSLAKLRLLLG